MKVLLVNDQGHVVASMENLEQYNADDPSDLFALMDFLETLIASAKGADCKLTSAA
jgi:hypothetical protein